ncbi:hypothetical protein EMPS_07329 [Entomortierella parvispora]|uniref:Uncharacterized protein n=1 Tax=Entomortierella parvispora TaxID=205924 RepID=A0A9P3HE81_9FUNG|nr:hypothetical protein EMPS_07329 [Entomortierella parvispora]
MPCSTSINDTSTNLESQLALFKIRIYVYIQGCSLEHSFFQVLMSNAPALESIFISRVAFHEPLSVDPATDQMTVAGFRVPSEEGRAPEDSIKMNMEASVIKSMILHSIAGLQLADILRFASNLPYLSLFNCDIGKHSSKDSDALLDHESLTGASGFQSIRDICLEGCPSKDTTKILQGAQRSLSDFGLTSSPVTEFLVQALVGGQHAVTLRRVMFRNVDLVDCEDAFHFILCSLSGLELLVVWGGVMVCKPMLLEQTRWVCSNLNYLELKPQCDRGGESYSVEESQNAFMKQVGSLKKLRRLIFEEQSGDGDTLGFAPEKSLDLLGTMPCLETARLGLQASRGLTIEHAKLILKKWPKLRRLNGVPVTENTAFVDYMREHGPDIKVRRYLHEP